MGQVGKQLFTTVTKYTYMYVYIYKINFIIKK